MEAQASRQWWGQPAGHDAGLPDWLEAYPLDGCLAPQVPLTHSACHWIYTP